MPQYPYTGVNNDLGALVTLANASSNGHSADYVNAQNRGIVVVVNISAISGTSAALQVTIQGKDMASGNYYTLLQSASLTATGLTTLTVYPGIAAASNTAADASLPQNWRVSFSISGTSPSVTGTIGACLLV